MSAAMYGAIGDIHVHNNTITHTDTHRLYNMTRHYTTLQYTTQHYTHTQTQHTHTHKHNTHLHCTTLHYTTHTRTLHTQSNTVQYRFNSWIIFYLPYLITSLQSFRAPIMSPLAKCKLASPITTWRWEGSFLFLVTGCLAVYMQKHL